MLTFVYPHTVNWFYAHLAHRFVGDLNRKGIVASAVSAEDLEKCSPIDECVLILSVHECALSAERKGKLQFFLKALNTYPRRILVNYDCIHTRYFCRHFTIGLDLITEIIDVGMMPQTDLETINGLPYKWVFEAFSTDELASLERWAPGRPVPWAIIGHANQHRAALVSACIQTLSPGGFVFLPPVRPYDAESGFDGERLKHILGKTDLYIWGSHHFAPFHEGLRAPSAVAMGAIPAKIDPLHSRVFASIPWVYPSLRALNDACSIHGLAALHRQAQEFLVSKGAVGDLLLDALGSYDTGIRADTADNPPPRFDRSGASDR